MSIIIFIITFKTNPVYRGRKQGLRTRAKHVLKCLKLTPFIGDGNLFTDDHISLFEASVSLKLTPFIGDGNHYKRAKV